VLALICVILGLVPVLAFNLMRLVLHSSRQGFGEVLADTQPMSGGFWTGMDGVASASAFAPLALAVVLVLMFLIARCISRLGSASRRADGPWLCGYAREAECHRYVAHHFYGEFKRYFRWLGGGTGKP